MNGPLDRAAHVLTTAERGFNLPVAVWTFGHLNFSPIPLGQCIVHEGFIAMRAGRVYGHAALVTLICSHPFTPN